MKTVYLLRHGETQGFSPRRFIGQMDVPLTDRGRAQIEQVAGFLQENRVDRLISSPLRRCLESAEILGRTIGLVPETEPSLSEIALGQWEGLTVAQVQQQYPGSYEARGRDIATFRPPEGESFADLRDRAWPSFLSIVNGPAEKIAIMAHAGVNRVLLCQLLKMPLTQLFCLRQDHACLNIIRIQAEVFELELMNYSSIIAPAYSFFTTRPLVREIWAIPAR